MFSRWSEASLKFRELEKWIKKMVWELDKDFLKVPREYANVSKRRLAGVQVRTAWITRLIWLINGTSGLVSDPVRSLCANALTIGPLSPYHVEQLHSTTTVWKPYRVQAPIILSVVSRHRALQIQSSKWSCWFVWFRTFFIFIIKVLKDKPNKKGGLLTGWNVSKCLELRNWLSSSAILECIVLRLNF